MTDRTEIWNWPFVWEILPTIIDAMWVTISATFVGFGIALVVGLLFALLRRSEVRALSISSFWVLEFIRTTPLLVQLYFIYYALPFYGVALNAFAAGVIGLGLHYATYLSEVYRSGIDAVPKAQWEASKALNFSPVQRWTKVILPQAVPPIIPVLGNYLIVMFKETPLLSAITLIEMLAAAKGIGASVFKYLEPITMVGVLFFLLSYPSSLLIQRLEKRFNRNVRV
jgi:polar amino acid transport system permease protein